MSRSVKKGALIGCGFFATNHMNAWTEIPDVEIVAVCDLDPTKAKDMARKFNVPSVYTDTGQMLAEMDLDFVDVATTAPSHRAIVEQACQHVGLIICQKPFAETLQDARMMVDAAHNTDTRLVIHENFRWQKAFMMMKSLIQDNRIGTPHFARFSFRHGYDNYRNQPYLAEIERFTLMDVGLHLFDLARHFMGDVARLSCTTQSVNPIVRGEDLFTALLMHENGATTICDCSFFTKVDPEPFPQTAAWIEGDEGTLELRTDFSLRIHSDGTHTCIDTEPEVPDWGARPWHNVQDSVLNFQTHVAQVLKGHGQASPSGTDNLKTLSLALAAYDAARTGQTIDMSRWVEGAV